MISLVSITLLSCSVTSRPRPQRFRRVHQQSDQAGDHECRSPYQVEIDPVLPENREAELAIDHPRDEPCNRKIGDRMDCGGESSTDVEDALRFTTLCQRFHSNITESFAKYPLPTVIQSTCNGSIASFFEASAASS